MIIPDVNLLLYANIDAFPQHVAARAWWEELLNGQDAVGLTAPAVFGFLRIATNRRVFDPPLALSEASRRVEVWLSRPQVHFVVPGPRHLEIVLRLLAASGASGNLTTDAQLAAYAIEHQGAVHSNDTDFGRFAGLRWVNPLG